ncbi:hypothetical protein FHS61_001593 [Altererythrobacter atlanticus]|uniref:PilZ domain-containing protein n=1 Tax=Croceibacterium atlanticum TaxID=1267766 RepID=UPI00062CDAE8|nr:PilZ domain-containing protein [Croceibacterium atlanticum]MBB5732584.1 hypothetical protein [Croceibacterium atlanticum]
MMLARSQPAVLEPIGDRRRKSRKRLRLQALHTADPQANQEEVLIHDLSETGLLLESSLQLKVGETVQVDLPTLKQVSARIVWQSGKLYGCQFNQPIPRSARSAAILRSPPLERQEAAETPWTTNALAEAPEPAVELFPRGVRMALALGLMLASWAFFAFLAIMLF